MKIRSDFVTNSSSTAFVIITNDSFERGDFLGLMGVTEHSPLIPLFDALYYHLQSSMYSVQQYFQRYQKAADDWLELLRREFAEEVVERIVQAERAGRKVFIGKLDSDDGDQIEAFFCTDSFEVENEKIYLNALECAW